MRTRVVVIALALSAAGGIAWFVTRPKKVEPTEVVTADVHRSTVVEKVKAIGHVEPVTQVKVSANVTGDLLGLYIKEGETVTKGTLLADIDRVQLAAIVRQNEANARSASASVLLETTQLSQALAELHRTEELFKKNLTPQAELDKARADVEVIRAREEAAKQRVEQARGALDEATVRLAKTKIFAPIDGTVIALNKKIGERIRGSDLGEDILLTLAPLHAMQVEVDISEQDVVRIKEGSVAEIVLDALGGEAVPGRVVEIANSAVIANKGTEMETTSFKVKVALDRNPERLRSGMSAQVSITTKTRPDVLSMPLEALTARFPSELAVRAGEEKHEDKGLFFRDSEAEKESKDPIKKRERPVDVVFVVKDGKVEPSKVKTGISSDLETEILEGLSGGEEVVIGPYKALAHALKPGTEVKVTRKLDKDAADKAISSKTATVASARR
ncbi:MAG: efflux RND transporter periplasmic adaptor subunit [Myxococcota bacterium]